MSTRKLLENFLHGDQALGLDGSATCVVLSLQIYRTRLASRSEQRYYALDSVPGSRWCWKIEILSDPGGDLLLDYVEYLWALPG